MNSEKYNCNNCNKTYTSYKSLWTHNKIHHNGIKNDEIVKEEIITEYTCGLCNKKYKHNPSKCRHEKNCTGIKQLNIELETEKMRQETEKIKNENLKLQIKLQGMKRIDTNTFKAMNKVLMDRSTTNNININITNNYQIMSIGRENVVETLSMYDKQLILDSRWLSLDKMVEIVHCRDHDMFKNIIITNLKDKFAYKYDDTKGYFITTTKVEVLDDIVTHRVINLEVIYNELSAANMIDKKTKKLIQDFLDKMEEEEPFTDRDDVEHPSFKSYKMNNIKILLYNNRDRITKDIALLIGDKKENIIPNNEIV